MDEDGYPTDDELVYIRNWPWNDIKSLFEFIRERWMYADCGYLHEEESENEFHEMCRFYFLHTGGWSGNESLIDALQENTMVWSITWYSSTRGGHYQFIVPE